jgi:hypothetical protein
MTNELAPARHPHNPHCEDFRSCLPHLGWRVGAENGYRAETTLWTVAGRAFIHSLRIIN